MLVSLNIRNIVLIDHLQLDFEGGLGVLSGETGAGKSILLDSIGLAIGRRSERELVRHGTDQGTVTAEFSIPLDDNLWQQLADNDIDYEAGSLILRRSLNTEGRSRAFINDQPVSATLLRQIGEQLVEIHGQHDERGLLNVEGHRHILDLFAGHDDLRRSVRKAYENWRDIQGQLRAEEEKLAAAQADEEYIRYNLEELSELAVEPGEEEQLANRRALMMRGEQMAGDLDELLKELLDKKGADAAVRGAARKVGRMMDQSGGTLNEVMNALDRAANEMSEAIAGLEELQRELDFDPFELERSEERLFAIRAASRKHHCAPDDLPALLTEFEDKLKALEFGDEEVRRLQGELKDAREAYERLVEKLSQGRQQAAAKLDGGVNAELPPLKLEKAQFLSHITTLEKEDWGPDGGERVEFQVSTNPGAPFGSLVKIASGGELSRFILALKVVLAQKSTIPTLIFDEIDRGVGGAVADAVGDRLERLSHQAQILVITHSPQVAARGDSHWLIAKSGNEEQGVVTQVNVLDQTDRREEIARMLAGATITDQARAAADSLIQGNTP